MSDVVFPASYVVKIMFDVIYIYISTCKSKQ